MFPIYAGMLLPYSRKLECYRGFANSASVFANCASIFVIDTATFTILPQYAGTAISANVIAIFVNGASAYANRALIFVNDTAIFTILPQYAGTVISANVIAIFANAASAYANRASLFVNDTAIFIMLPQYSGMFPLYARTLMVISSNVIVIFANGTSAFANRASIFANHALIFSNDIAIFMMFRNILGCFRLCANVTTVFTNSDALECSRHIRESCFSSRERYRHAIIIAIFSNVTAKIC